MMRGSAPAFLIFLLAVVASVTGLRAEPLAEAIAATDANVIFMRHALAPGYGDPADFNVNDCASQRNLDAEGRAQAAATGAWLQQNNHRFDTILSSAWCRCKDTASGLDLGPWQVFDGLNSFFEGHVDRAETLRLLDQQMAAIPPDGKVLMVTHQVVISAVTGIAPPSGGMVVYNTVTGAARSVRLDLD